MKEKAIVAAMGKSLQETMEAMAFLELVPMLDAVWQAEYRQVAIDTLDEWAGSLWLRIDVGLLQEIIENIYAIDRSDITTEIERDTLAELLNTLAGKVLRKLTVADHSFRLGLPEAKATTDSVDGVKITFDCDGRLVEVIWQTNSMGG